MTFTAQDLQRLIRDIAFQSGFTTLENAYMTSVGDSSDARARAEAAVRARHGIPVGQPLPPIEIDEHGDPSIDFHDEVDQIAEGITSTHQILVEVLTTALFHFWEKEANKWLGKERYVHDDVMAWLKARGANPDERALKELQLVVNALKHGPGDSARKLLAHSPTLFNPNLRSQPGFIPSNANIRLTKSLLDGYFAAVQTSA